MTHLGLDLLFLVPGLTGGRETYARELSAALRAVDPDLRITAFLNRETAGTGWWSEHSDAVVRLPVSARSPASWGSGEAALLPVAAARARVDVLHGVANFVPAVGPFARVLTLHDILFRTHPELHGRPTRWATEALIVPAARRAHRLIVGSAAAAEDIRAALRTAPIDVVPHGVSPPDPGDAVRARRRLGACDRPLVLTVATDLPHKRLSDVLDAVALLPAPRPLLAIAGARVHEGALPELVVGLRLSDDVRLLGPVPSDELEDLYAAADILLTLTASEGFGLPVLEAMARGVPVVCSDLPVLREIGGPDAAYVGNASEAAEAMIRVLRSPPAGGLLRARAARYTWAAAAEGTLDTYRRALESRSTTRKARLS